jgi:hypothetical protein
MASNKRMLLEKRELQRFARISGVPLNESFMQRMVNEEDEKDDLPPVDEDFPADTGADEDFGLDDETTPPDADTGLPDDLPDETVEDMPDETSIADVAMDPEEVKNLVAAITDAIEEITGVDIEVDDPSLDDAGEMDDLDAAPEEEIVDEVPAEDMAEEIPDVEGETSPEEEADMLKETISYLLKKGNKELAKSLHEMRQKILAESKKTPVTKKTVKGKVILTEELVRRITKRISRRLLQEKRTRARKNSK